MVGMVEMVNTVLESAKDRIVGVDTPGQHEPPHVQYGMACLLIRTAIGFVSCLIELGWASFFVSYM
jgi:GTPase Era involved in 16S rRNA processing